MHHLLCYLLSTVILLIWFSAPALAKAPGQAASQQISILYQKPRGFTKQLIEQLDKELKQAGYRTQYLRLTAEFNLQELQQQDLVVTVGTQTTKAVLESQLNRPVLSLLIPKDVAEKFRTQYPSQQNWSNLLIDQPLDRHFQLISQVLGKRKNTGVLLSSYSKQLKPSLKKAARQSSHRLVTQHISDQAQLSSSFKSMSSKIDALLTVPDPTIYNKNTIRGLLLQSYRNRIPIFGFSSAYVKAGAIAAIYSQPGQISHQAANIINQFMHSGRFSQPAYYPEDFSVSLNHKVAHSLGIKLPEPSAIVQHIKRSEKKI